MTRKAHKVWMGEAERRGLHAPSYVTVDGHEFLLNSEDKGKRREEIYKRDEGKCRTCGKELPLEGEYWERANWHHVSDEPRCDCMHNGIILCYEHHRVTHNREPQLKSVPGIQDNSK